MQTYRVLGSDAGTREGHECLCSSLLHWMAARFGMETIVAEVRQRAGMACISPCCSKRALKGDHAANGLAEVGVREIKAQTRVLKSHLEERLKRQLDWSEPLARWLVRHSANCLSRYRFKQVGRRRISSAQERWRRQAVDFGEKAARGRRCGENDGLHFRWSSRAHWRASLFLSERGLLRGHGSSAENRRPAVGQRYHSKEPRSSVDAHWRRA